MAPTDASARAERLRVVAVEMDRLVREIGPMWIRLAHLRSEAREICEELAAKCPPESTGTVALS